MGAAALQAGDHAGQALAGLGGVVGGEDLADGGGDHRLLGLAAVAQHVAQEVHGAALPGAAQHLGDGRLQALVGIGDAERHAGQAAGPQAAQELAPEGLGLGFADVDADHLAPARLVHAVGDHQRLVAHAAGLSRTRSTLASSQR